MLLKFVVQTFVSSYIVFLLASTRLIDAQVTSPHSLITGHRGASSVAPENTLAAFHKAWEVGCDAIEGDFRLTADKKIVCIHDSNTQRTTGIDKDVSKTSLQSLQTLDFGTWKDVRYAGETCPTLSQVLLTVPSADGPQLRISTMSQPITLKDFDQAIRLFGDGGLLYDKRIDCYRMISKLDTVHIATVRGNQLGWFTASENYGQSGAWKSTWREMNGDVEILDMIAGQRVVALYRIQRSEPTRWELGLAFIKDNRIVTRNILQSVEWIDSAQGWVSENDELTVVWTESELAPQVRMANVSLDAEAITPPESIINMGEGINPDVIKTGVRTILAWEEIDGNIRVAYTDDVGFRMDKISSI